MSVKLPDTIKFIITDFDGICTDNCVYIDAKGDMSRKINFKDIMGFSLLKKNGYKVGIISGEKNSAIEKISQTFKIDEVHQDIRIKIDVIKLIVEKYNLTQEEFLYIGDDVNDYDSLCYAKYRITVPDAVQKIKNIDGIQITEAHSGNGAFREVVDAVMNA
jgi:YrbI family 3-deoxy-D-manno-octulosonate 8-phosphate phosphatase